MGSDTIQFTDEEAINILKTRIAKFKADLKDPKTFTYSIYQSDDPKANHIREWAKALKDLHTLGVYKDEIWTISTHIRRELIAMGIPQAIPHARKSLPDEYKDLTKVHARTLLAYEMEQMRDHHDPETVKSKEDYARINKRSIQRYTETRDTINKFLDKLHKHEYDNKIEPFLLDEMQTNHDQSNKNLNDAMDGRDKVLPEKLHLMMQAATEVNKSHAFVNYLLHVRKLLEQVMTSKQNNKIITGRITKVEVLYDPKSRSMARHAGFSGIKCGECSSWRIDERYDGARNRLFCFACKTWNDIKTEKLVSKMI